MDHRGFLKRLAGLMFPLRYSAAGLDAATEAEIETAWQQLVSAPIRFAVGKSRDLSVADMAEPVCRADCVDIEISDRPTAEEIYDVAAAYWVAAWVVAQAYLDSEKDINGDPSLVDVEVLRDWLNVCDENVLYAATKLRQWLAGEDLDEDDYDEAESRGNTPRSAALNFWSGGILDRREFGVVIVEGDHPGSSYFAAELRVPLDKANATAKAQGVPIRFERFNPKD